MTDILEVLSERDTSKSELSHIAHHQVRPDVLATFSRVSAARISKCCRRGNLMVGATVITVHAHEICSSAELLRQNVK
jgi:hypothetical protein